MEKSRITHLALCCVFPSLQFAVLSSPGNPLGTVTGWDELKRISKVLEEQDLHRSFQGSTCLGPAFACAGCIESAPHQVSSSAALPIQASCDVSQVSIMQ